MSKNFMSGLLSLVLGAIYFFTATQFPEVTAGDRTGPKLFPLIIGSVAMIAGGLLCVLDRRSGKGQPIEWNFVADRAVWSKILVIMLLGISYGLVLDSWGYLVATTVFMFCITLLINRRHFLQNLLISIFFPVVTYAAFAVALQLSLPRGIIENMLPF
ncbi:MAG TPA: tripartite tricarboxylate transporter TctB family protein [Synergistales bacterium]|jgi:putative tricarboxylic transport membrane protein|nr:tripartite tricarboxylate transporter TctB family protein [Synergistaceae bacterium]NLD96430.1 tripartite tricarboxylate transporter TctB family protein [Synergistaceae bacterium]HOO89072.1 tripartite tricarboxylate transporter TctB family protein [Synergistales bacterium]HPE65900.1 tripartite tricarboxylate transporter TctB family protein [Synergistales bacterium]HRV98546.1 tripartite tricarboxylate transporter TctB family protein [Aminobacteriaceae bacterium]